MSRSCDFIAFVGAMVQSRRSPRSESLRRQCACLLHTCPPFSGRLKRAHDRRSDRIHTCLYGSTQPEPQPSSARHRAAHPSSSSAAPAPGSLLESSRPTGMTGRPCLGDESDRPRGERGRPDQIFRRWEGRSGWSHGSRGLARPSHGLANRLCGLGRIASMLTRGRTGCG